jgi:hypothetical protein
MSYATITQAAHDAVLAARIDAAVYKEALSNPTFGETVYGRQVLTGTLYPISGPLRYPVAIDTEAAYESAVIAENPDPGGDPSVVSDAAILSSVQAHWPPDQAAP